MSRLLLQCSTVFYCGRKTVTMEMDNDDDNGNAANAAPSVSAAAGFSSGVDDETATKANTPLPTSNPSQLKQPPPTSSMAHTPEVSTCTKSCRPIIVNPYAAVAASSSTKWSSNVQNQKTRMSLQPPPPPQQQAQLRPTRVIPINPYAKVKNDSNNNVRYAFYGDKERQQSNDVASHEDGMMPPAKSSKVDHDLAANHGDAPVRSSCVGGAPAGAATLKASTLAVTTTTTQQTWRPYYDRLPSKSLQSGFPVDVCTTDNISNVKDSPAATAGATNLPLQAPPGSLGPAEVLTVAECVEHAELYVDRPVRVTGVVQHRSFLAVDDANGNSYSNASTDDHHDHGQGLVVQLELKDPLMEMAALGGNGSAVQRRKGSTTGQYTIPAASRRNSTPNGGSVGLSKSSSSTKKRNNVKPWFQNSSSNLRRKSSLGAGGNIGRNNLLCRSSVGSITAKILQETTKNRPVLKVLVDPKIQQLDTVVIDSIVMVIGTVRSIPVPDGQQKHNGTTTTTTTTTTTKGYELESETNNADFKREGATNQNIAPTGNVYKLDARLVQVMPHGSNLTLYKNALEVRRKTLWKRYYAIHCSIGGNQDRASSKVLVQGCGPPPYDKWISDI